jgi:hypothetical protein
LYTQAYIVTIDDATELGMKNVILSAGILSIAALVAGCAANDETDEGTTSQDVVTAKCPANIFATFENLDAYSFSEIEQHEGFYLNDDDKDALRAPLRAIETMPGDKYEAILNLKTHANAECTYESATSQKVTAKFYTKSGKNILRIDASDPQAKDLSFYVTVKQYTSSSVTLASPSAGIIFRDSNADAAFNPRFIGRAFKSSLSVAVPE